MANELNTININYEKLFLKCKPKQKPNECNDIINNQNYNKDKQILIDLDFINDNTMNETNIIYRDREDIETQNSSNNSVKTHLSHVGFKLDQLLLSPEEEYKPLSNINNKPYIDDNEDNDSEENNGKDYHLRESRIEIAGGREIFSASKTKLSKKRQNPSLLSHNNQNSEQKIIQNSIKSRRNNTTQTSTQICNSIKSTNNDISTQSEPIVSSLQSNLELTQFLHSPICDMLTDLTKTVEHKLASGIVVYEDSTSKEDSEIIYDDIEEIDKRELQLSVKPVSNDTQNSTAIKSFPNLKQCVTIEPSIDSDSNDINDEQIADSECYVKADDSVSNDSSTDQTCVTTTQENGIARIIGNVPIAQYDGSPRRYGPKPPGYPQRVINNEDLSVGLANSNTETKALVDISCDELVKSILSIPIPHEDSPTNSNKSICSKSDIQSAQISEHDSDKNSVLLETTDMNAYNFSDLDYKLYRMDTVGNSYVGKRLATLSSANSEDDRSVEVSPSKSLNNDSSSMLAHENELILLHERVRQHILNEIVSVDRSSVSTCPGTEPETEVAERVVEDNRNFTLSPDITDCDSNEIESEISLSGSLLSNSKVVTSMPILEDGLSSGVPSSDNELEDDSNFDSPITLAYVKKQICDIEEEIVAKLKAKLKRNDSILDHQIGYSVLPNDSNHSQTTNCGLNHSHSYKDEPIDRQNSSVQTELQSTAIEYRDEESTNRKDSNEMISSVENNSCESIWVPRTTESTCNKSVTSSDDTTNSNTQIPRHHDEECDTDQETDRLLGAQRSDDRGFFDEKERNKSNLTSMSSLFKLSSKYNHYIKIENCSEEQSNANKRSNATREVLIHEPQVLIEGVLFRARYLGSTQLVCEGQPTKATRMMQAEEAVSRIKAPEGETQPSTDVDLFISTEKIMVLNTDLKEIMMDHTLRTISYIADIGDLLVLMARRRVLNNMEDSTESAIKRIPKMICHVFESEEAQFIAQSIGQAFQVAYMEFLKANGIEDSSFVKEMDYQEVLNSQEIFGNELEMFAKKEKQKEVIVPKQKGEILGMVIVESGWGSMLPTVVIANMAQHGPSARCGQLNIGDQIIAINGVSLVGLPLSTCQAYIKNTKNQTVVKLTVVPCAPVVEVKIKRPDTKYQLGFSVQNGVICSLLRGGIAERGGVRVGHRIIEINGQSVVAVPHDRIVNLLATSVGEIHMKTMPTSMFRLLTGQEMPTYM